MSDCQPCGVDYLIWTVSAHVPPGLRASLAFHPCSNIASAGKFQRQCI